MSPWVRFVVFGLTYCILSWNNIFSIWLERNQTLLLRFVVFGHQVAFCKVEQRFCILLKNKIKINGTLTRRLRNCHGLIHVQWDKMWPLSHPVSQLHIVLRITHGVYKLIPPAQWKIFSSLCGILSNSVLLVLYISHWRNKRRANGEINKGCFLVVWVIYCKGSPGDRLSAHQLVVYTTPNWEPVGSYIYHLRITINTIYHSNSSKSNATGGSFTSRWPFAKPNNVRCFFFRKKNNTIRSKSI